MLRVSSVWRSVAAACALVAPLAHAALPSADELLRLAPDASPQAIRLALSAAGCAESSLDERQDYLTVIDFSRPSREKRLWVFDLRQPRLVFEEWVTHGKNSGGDLASTFSNRPNCYQTSLGLFRTGATYRGKHGTSLRLEGLEPGINHNSEARGIVIHSAAYADPGVVPSLGRLGRSEGCPAVRPAVAPELIRTLSRGSYVFAYYPQQDWLSLSRFLAGASCRTSLASRQAASGHL